MRQDPPSGTLDGTGLDPVPDPGPAPLVRTLRTVVGTMLLVGLVVGGFALVSHLAKDVRTESGRLDLGDAPQLILQVPSADVRIVAGDVPTPTYEARVTDGLLETDFALGRRGSAVQVGADCRTWLAPGCGADLVITVPEGLQVEVVAGTGDVELAGLSGVVIVRSDEGDVDVESATVRDLTITTGSGDVDAGFREQPFAVKVTTGSGDVELDLPRGDRGYEVEAASSDGDVQDLAAGDGTVEEGARLVLVRSGSGDIDVDRPR